MIKVVFIGDKPSSKNLSEDIPFVGANCFERFVSFIKRINPDYYLALNSETERELQEIETLVEGGFKVVCMGKVAAIRLRDRSIPHMTLPHPSGRNLQVNDEQKVNSMLEEAWIYVRSSHG